MRIVVIGTSGAGKSTFARRIAARLGLPHIELGSRATSEKEESFTTETQRVTFGDKRELRQVG